MRRSVMVHDRWQNVPDPVAAARRAFVRLGRRPPEGVAFAPGRVNLVGEHTDYNDGFVLPMAIREGVAAAFASRSDGVLRVHASDIGDTREVSLAGLGRGKGSIGGWFRYAAGMAWAMLAADVTVRGADVVLAANLPSGAGLSSSAAVELVIARALTAVAGLAWDPRAASLMAQRAEHEFAGVACGIMDQMVVACAADGHALLIDCRSLDIREVALPADVRVVVMNTGIRRSLATSAYNDRRAACERAVAGVQPFAPSVRALRDVDRALLERARTSMDDVAFRRASHVVAENLRPVLFARAIEAGDLATAGRVMNDSHQSLRELYEVSCRELDALVALSTAQPECYGARLTGAGFGGCAIAMVKADRVEPFAAMVQQGYRAETGRHADVIVSRPSAGTRLVE
ncbi:MAG: galactokinase [Vicinamibacterales bacterium]